MTYPELIVTLWVLSVFAAGFSSAAMPVFRASARAEAAYAESRETGFLIESFHTACRAGTQDFTEWRRAVSVVDGVGDIRIQPCLSPMIPPGTRVWKLTCTFREKELTVYGEGAAP